MNEILASLIKNIGKGTFKTIFYVVVISMFWQVGIYMFKPDFLKELIVIQIPLYFSLSFIWFMFYFLVFFRMEHFIRLYTKEYMEELRNTRVDTYISLSLVFKSLYLIIGYYYSLSFTGYLQLCSSATCLLLLLSYSAYYIKKHAN
ncbi:hypothetical protein [Flavobacterium yafengii]|uniref:Uncharacterized protein n=1 Tax=Flavobacterium yafengii TaxID=3041253 RepID=A0AAW6TRW0_9FLAO|nr:hypothetical protein [Flavobacterium yafengii]MDI5950550.1 hypothetical protein [Flavobacterium yafengii]